MSQNRTTIVTRISLWERRKLCLANGFTLRLHISTCRLWQIRRTLSNVLADGQYNWLLASRVASTGDIAALVNPGFPAVNQRSPATKRNTWPIHGVPRCAAFCDAALSIIHPLPGTFFLVFHELHDKTQPFFHTISPPCSRMPFSGISTKATSIVQRLRRAAPSLTVPSLNFYLTVRRSRQKYLPTTGPSTCLLLKIRCLRRTVP